MKDEVGGAEGAEVQGSGGEKAEGSKQKAPRQKRGVSAWF